MVLPPNSARLAHGGNACAGPRRRIPHPIWTPSMREQASAGKAGLHQAYELGQGDTMAIWFNDFSVEDTRQLAAGCMIGVVGIELTERGNGHRRAGPPAANAGQSPIYSRLWPQGAARSRHDGPRSVTAHAVCRVSGLARCRAVSVEAAASVGRAMCRAGV
jgi:hypothetical protein